MRFFVPIYLRACEFHSVKIGLQRRASPLPVSVAFHGLVNFTPVRVSNVLLRTFDTDWLGNPYALLDMDALNGCEFPYMFDEGGAYDKLASTEEQVFFTTHYEQFLLTTRVPRSLRDGDILLASRKYPLRGQSLELR